MLGLVRELDQPVTFLDFGCGLAHLLDFIDREPRYRLVHTGLTSPNTCGRRGTPSRRLVSAARCAPA
jgi:hypothetical protein